MMITNRIWAIVDVTGKIPVVDRAHDTAVDNDGQQ